MFQLLFSIFFFLPSLLWGQSTVTSKGELRFESRLFTDDKASSTQDGGYGLAGRLEVDHNWGRLQNRAQVFSRVDYNDSTRQRMNVEELYSQWAGQSWVFFAGYKTLNWSTAEAFHPTDVINSRNFDSPLENAEKIGELMAGFQYLSESLNLFAFYMPSLVSPQLPGQSNRLSFTPEASAIPGGVAVNEVQFVDNNGEIKKSTDFVEQWALRAQLPVGDWEFNLYWVHHYDRTDFKALQNLASPTPFNLTPLLAQVDHYAFAFQFVWEEWIFKSENVYRDFKENIFINSLGNNLTQRDYGMSSLALEYLWSHPSGSDTTFIVEFQELYGVEKSLRYSINPFQRDLLVGARHSFNDIQGKELFLSLIADMERGREILAAINYSQRLSDVWKIATGLRYIDAPTTNALDITGMRALNNDHQLNLTLSRFF